MQMSSSLVSHSNISAPNIVSINQGCNLSGTSGDFDFSELKYWIDQKVGTIKIAFLRFLASIYRPSLNRGNVYRFENVKTYIVQ